MLESSAQYIAPLEKRVMHKLEGEVERLKHSCLEKLSLMHEDLKSARANRFSSPEYDQRVESLEGDLEEVQQMLQSAEMELRELKCLLNRFRSHDVHESHQQHEKLSLPTHRPLSSSLMDVGPGTDGYNPIKEEKRESDTQAEMKVSRFCDFVHRMGMPSSFESGAMRASNFVTQSASPGESRCVFAGKFSPDPLTDRHQRKGDADELNDGK